MTNYYAEFNLNPNADSDTILRELRKQKKTWVSRQNAPDPKRRQKAEQMGQLIEEALVIFSDKAKRKEYDKKLARENKKSGGSRQTQAQEQPQYSEPVGSPNAGNEQIILQEIRNVYDSGNTDATIQACQRYLNMGMRNSEIYKYLGYAYQDSGDIRMAVAEYKNGLLINPDDADFYVNLARVYLFTAQDPAQAEQYLGKALRMLPGSPYVMSLNIYKFMLEGKVKQADDMVNNYLSIHPDDRQYRQYVSNVYEAYSDRYLSTAANGAYYYANEADYQNRTNILRRAQVISGSQEPDSLLQETLELGKKAQYKDSILGCVVTGIVAAIFIMAGAEEEMVSMIFLGLLLVAATIALIYFNVMPKWRIMKMDVTGKRETASAIAYWTGKIGTWALFIFVIAFTAILAGLGSGDY